MDSSLQKTAGGSPVDGPLAVSALPSVSGVMASMAVTTMTVSALLVSARYLVSTAGAAYDDHQESEVADDDGGQDGHLGVLSQRGVSAEYADGHNRQSDDGAEDEGECAGHRRVKYATRDAAA